MDGKKLVIILGVNGNLGSAFANSVPSEYDIIGVDKVPSIELGGLTKYRICDFMNPSEIRDLIKSLSLKEYTKVYVVSCLGVFGDDSFSTDRSDEEVEQILYQTIQINLTGIAHFLLLFLRKFADIPTKVVLVGSTASHVGGRDLGYGASKAGLNGLVLSLSKSLSSKNLEIVGINPGIFNSKMCSLASTSVAEERRQQAINGLHTKKLPEITEVLNLLHYAAFQAPNYLTGSIIKINGGQYS